MFKAGREPAAKGDIGPFYDLMLEYAEAEKDAALFEKALGKLRENFGDNPRMEKYWKTQEDRLAKIKGGGEEKKDEGGGEMK